MALLRIGLATAFALGMCGCAPGGPERASDIQNLNAATDDIAAVAFTQSPGKQINDPNKVTVVPHNYETLYTR